MDVDGLIQFLQQFALERRVEIFDRVLAERTRYITVVLEDIYQSQNASAVLRSCDGFGIQDVHIIENRNRFSISRDVALGSDKWLTLHKYSSRGNNTEKAFEALKRDGYRIVATVPSPGATLLEDFELERSRTALVFGTEQTGLSKEAINLADEHLYIPMYGFTGSLNISVSVAVILHHLTNELRRSPLDWHLTHEEAAAVKLLWLRKTIRRSELLEKQFLKK